jgi:hypothetical protein
MKKSFGLTLLLSALIAACNVPASNPAQRPTSASAAPAPSPTPRPPDLAHRPLYWFAPLPPQPTGPYNGSDDFMQLFAPGASWDGTAGHIQVFKLYGGWVAHDSTQAQVSQAIQAIRQRGLGLAVEVGPLISTADCGFNVESFAGEEGIVGTIQRIKSLGGRLDLIAFDEPYYFGHFYDGENACHWTAEKIAQGVDSFIQRARLEFPDVIIGDIEPLTGPAGPDQYKDWLDLFKKVNGYDLAFLHLDVDWSDTRWPAKAQSIADYGRARDIPVGIIFTGNYQDQTDEAWVSIAGERVKRYEAEAGGPPEQVIFQSWNDKPDHVLPESNPTSFTGFVKTYFENRSAIGFQSQSSDNLALKKTVRVSRQLQGNEGQWAVDGDPGTVWNAGDGPTQWIEIDLGAAYDIREIRLLLNQYPDGRTVHRVLGKGVTGSFALLYTFDGQTRDSQLLSYAPPEAWQGIQVIRIETTASPSWVSWREIEIIQ